MTVDAVAPPRVPTSPRVKFRVSIDSYRAAQLGGSADSVSVTHDDADVSGPSSATSPIPPAANGSRKSMAPPPRLFVPPYTSEADHDSYHIRHRPSLLDAIPSAPASPVFHFAASLPTTDLSPTLSHSLKSNDAVASADEGVGRSPC